MRRWRWGRNWTTQTGPRALCTAISTSGKHSPNKGCVGSRISTVSATSALCSIGVLSAQGYVHTDLGDDRRGGRLLDAGNRLQQTHGLLIGLEMRLDLGLRLSDSSVEDVDMGK